MDGRKLSHATLEELRLRAVRMVESGIRPDELAKTLGLNRSTIFKWIKLNVDGGEQALKAKPIPGRPSTLEAKHLRWLSRILIDKTPRQLKLPFGLWTRDQIIEVVRRKYGIKLSKSALSRVLCKLGFTFQKPALRFKQQDPIIVNKWLTTDYPLIQEEALRVDAEIYFGDEACVSSAYALGKTIGKKGVTPVIKRTSKRFKVNMLSAVSAKGSCRFMVTEKSGTTEVFITFLKRLIDGAKRPIFLIVDNHPIHKSKKVQAFVESNRERIKLFYLPPYSPELNPDEMVWNDVKNHELSRHLIDNLETLKKIVYSRLFQLQKKTSKVISFFKLPTTVYASL